MIAIRELVVHKTLSVADLVVEPKRVKARYHIVRHDGTENHSEFIYSYDQVCFDPKKAEDVNLASMMVAQVALNYGLFFEQIIFDGLYDRADKRFLKDMMENTCREILVHKFFAHNEFLKPPYDQVKPEKLNKYTAAEIIFVNNGFAGFTLEPVVTLSEKDHFVILSSGGKDSLLTYGIARELGVPHPVFINESGRHWFTAVNAHRHFKNIDPNTSKPWCNSDRIFNWMVKHMPFIKENYQNIRSDIYPLRLWTVSVFLFGALPIARKRQVGNILIGNEYDTTLRGNYEGISHYSALYDQSKYFDNALTRYYQNKGWNIRQYSLLRSLSELLILKILVKRYPDLQRYQVSCHAAHESGGTMLPCGKCEKCRRVIGMLKALDEDPKRCGYSDEQIVNGLEALSKKSVKQIGSDAAHLYHLLLSKQLIADNEHTRKMAKTHPEILMLRFDQERSNLHDLPDYILEKLFGIYLEYTDKAVRREKGRWEEMNLKQEINHHLN